MLFGLIWWSAIPQEAAGQVAFAVDVSAMVYKEVDGHQLTINVYTPKGIDTDSLPAVVFFFGGGWNIGNPKVFDKQARYLASRGMVAFCPEYRVGSRHGTGVAECVKDAKSAMRFVVRHAGKFGVDPTRIVAAGVSAGGHLAASLACIDGFDEVSDDIDVPVNPFALVLFCPALRIERENLNDAYRERFAGLEPALSPYHHVRGGMPPTLVLSGTDDKQVPLADLQDFSTRMTESGNHCLLKTYARQGHAFFHYDRNPDLFQETLHEMEVFLEKLVTFKHASRLETYMEELRDDRAK